MNKLLKSIYILSLVMLAAIPTKAAVSYTVTPLGNFSPMAINANGDVIGNISTSTYSTAVIYSNGSLTELNSLEGLGSYASDINDSGQIVGNYMLMDGTYHAFSYSNGIMTDLGALGGLSSFADSINNSGQIVGCINTSGDDYSAFLLNNGKLTNLGNLGGSRVFAEAINSSGQIAGTSNTQDDSGRAFIYENKTMTDLGTFGGYSMALAINDSGQIVGQSATASGIVHAFLYSGGKMNDISELNGISVAYDINNRGQIVGALASINHAFLYNDVAIIDLNTLINSNSGVTLCAGIGINNSGQILVSGYYNNDLSAGVFILTPITEPSTIIHISIFCITFTTFIWKNKGVRNQY